MQSKSPYAICCFIRVLSWNQNNDNPTLDGAPIDIETVQVLRINTSKFSPNELAEIEKLPKAVPILDDNTPTVDDPILINIKVVAVHDSNEVCSQFQVKQTKTAPGPNSTKHAIYFGQGLSIGFAFS